MAVETTALCGLSLLREKAKYAEAIQRVQWFLIRNNHVRVRREADGKDGFFATTQGTVLSLQFLVLSRSAEDADHPRLTYHLDGVETTVLPSVISSGTPHSEFLTVGQHAFAVSSTTPRRATELVELVVDVTVQTGSES